MTKKNKIKLIVAIILVIISGYIAYILLYNGPVRTIIPSPYLFREEMDKDIITLEIKEGSVSKDGMSFVLKNHTTKLLGQTGYKIEHKMFGTWFIIKPKKLFKVSKLSLSSVANIYANEVKEYDFDWEFGIGSLPKGKYRIVKDIYTFPTEDVPKYVYAEFEIK